MGCKKSLLLVQLYDTMIRYLLKNTHIHIMDTQTFITTVQAHTVLPPAILEELVRRAPELDDATRQGIADELEKATKNESKILDDGLITLAGVQHSMKKAERDESEAADRAAEVLPSF